MNTIEDYCDLLEFRYIGKSKSFYEGYKYAFKRLEKYNYIMDIQNNSLDIKPSVMEKDFGDVSISSIIKNFQALLFILEVEKYNDKTINYFKEYFKTICDRQNQAAEDQEMSEKEMENWIDYLDLFERFKQYYEYEVKDKEISYDKLRGITLIGLFVCIPPARLGNYTDMKFKFRKKLEGRQLQRCYNYLFCDRSDCEDYNYKEFKLIHNNYKTCNVLGQVIYDLYPSFNYYEYLTRPVYQEGSVIIADLLEKYLDKRLLIQKTWSGINRRVCNDYLFTTEKGSFMTTQNMNYMLNTSSNHIFGKELSCNMFRHIFMTHYLKQNMDIKSNRQVALLMGQTYNPTMMEKYVKKPKPKKKTKEKISVNFD